MVTLPLNSITTPEKFQYNVVYFQYITVLNSCLLFSMQDSNMENTNVSYTLTPKIIPTIKLREPNTHNPWEFVDCESTVIKVMDLVTVDGRKTNAIYDTIVDSGGLHAYFDWHGPFILSSIAPDKTIRGLDSELYSDIISSIGADYYLTPDGETYLNDNSILSFLEIDRVVEETKSLRDSLPSIPIIGLVKGTNYDQIGFHINQLLELDIEQYCFHSSEYTRNNNYVSVGMGQRNFEYVRNQVPYLISYGIGSRRSIRQYQTADAFVTQSHFTYGFNGYILKNGCSSKLPKHYPVNRNLIMGNLIDIANTAENLNKNQTTLDAFGTSSSECYGKSCISRLSRNDCLLNMEVE